jgi:hypothetical protein
MFISKRKRITFGCYVSFSSEITKLGCLCCVTKDPVREVASQIRLWRHLAYPLHGTLSARV